MKEEVTKKTLSRGEVTDFVIYSRKFKGYKWYKPILEIILAGIIWIIGTAICIGIATFITVLSGGDSKAFLDTIRGGYDTFNTYSVPGVLYSLASVACLIPGVAFATKVLKTRPFHTVASSCGGFSFRIFFKVIIPALIIIGIPVAIVTIISAATIGSSICSISEGSGRLDGLVTSITSPFVLYTL